MHRLLTAAFAASVLVPASASAVTAAQGDYAGNWSVVIMTDKGTCDKAYRYAVVVGPSGAISYGGQSGFKASGKVGANGAVNVRISRGSDAAQGSGRLTAASGSGTWVAPSGDCSGRWKASRTK